MTITAPSIKPLLIRLLSGLLLAPLVVAMIYYGGFVFMAVIFLVLLRALYEWKRLLDNNRRAKRLFLFGALYITIGVSSFVALRYSFDDGALLAIMVICCVWLSDIMAFIFGKSFRGPKMAPRLSPNKTWAGLGGAMLGGGLALVLAAAIGEHYFRLSHYSYGFLFFGGLVLGFIGQVGDLVESYYKRRAGTKDAGQLIPGHGGILDRIDSALLVVPVFYLMVLLWKV